MPRSKWYENKYRTRWSSIHIYSLKITAAMIYNVIYTVISWREMRYYKLEKIVCFIVNLLTRPTVGVDKCVKQQTGKKLLLLILNEQYMLTRYQVLFFWKYYVYLFIVVHNTHIRWYSPSITRIFLKKDMFGIINKMLGYRDPYKGCMLS